LPPFCLSLPAAAIIEYWTFFRLPKSFAKVASGKLRAEPCEL
jgi:hypothetical protein